MTNPVETTVFWVEKIIAIAVFLQTVEMIQIQETFTQNGVWKWEILQKDYESFPGCFRRILKIFLDHPGFTYVVLIRLIAALALLILPFSNSLLIGILLICSFLVSLRWRGSFNGASDSMTLLILIALFLAQLFKNDIHIVEKCLWYIAIQSCLSYFIGGLGKIQQIRWRQGKALFDFIQFSPYPVSQRLKKLSEKNLLLHLTTWSVVTFECSFPLAFFNPKICLFLIAVALVFHLGNVYIFGLNRFLFAWSATYPALYFCSKAILK
jgi:hypothetical protein